VRLGWLVLGGLLGCVLGCATGAALGIRAQPSAEIMQLADEAGVDAEELAGASASTGLEPRAYLIAVGHLEAPRPAASAGPFGLSRYLTRVARCESDLDPGARGRAGEIGLFQLHPRGLLPTFYDWGFSNPYNGWEQARFAELAFARGLAHHWACA
jgi:hypothetical protein